ncbi:MAG: ATP-binding protein [Aggregatilineales bacterium]
MIENARPDPDALLAVVQEHKAQEQRGKLKIFLGMSPGVGKTYAMLESAHQRANEGTDVVIGYVETHRRAETDELVKGLPLIPRRKSEYRGLIQEEMDTDAVLARKPTLVLVDELAHTNAEGSRHPKRYQDVLEILAAGINVYTTLNVQHLDSRVDTVQQITGITVRETVPDLLIDIAAEVELIDLPPDELLKRLEEGKVYSENKVQQATDNFFRAGNLSALREMALRLTAERVEQQLTDYMQFKLIPGPWKSSERLMVAISASPLSERLVRWTRRMAYNLTAPWLAVYVEGSSTLDPKAQAQLARNLSKVHQLGGELVTVAGPDVVSTIIQTARQHNVTQIVIGKPARARLSEFLSGGSLVDRLIRASGDIDVYVVSGDPDEKSAPSTSPVLALHSGLHEYLIAVLAVIAAILVNLALLPVIGYQAVALLLLGVVMLLGSLVGRGPILVAAGLSALLWDYLFIPPRYTFYISAFQDWLMFGLYFGVALVIGSLTTRQRAQDKAIRKRAANISALYQLARDTTESVKLDDVLRAAVKQIGQVFDAKVAILLKTSDKCLATTPHPAGTLPIDDREWGAADWAFRNEQTAGRYTETMPTASGQYWPLIVPGNVVGTIGIQLTQRLSVDQEGLLQTFVSHIALAVERELLSEQAQHTALSRESERLYATLLDSVSHELRTPLTAINGATSSLFDPAVQRSPDKQQALGQEIQDATHRLNRLVDNLLDMSRLESGRLKLNLDWCDVHDLVNVSVAQVKKELADHDLIIDMADKLPLVRIDFALMEQVLVNLLHNAALYTSPGVRVRVTATAENGTLVLSVADRGPGLPPADLERVFEKFYRAPGARSGGTGLGLSICKGFVEAHGGTITAENRPTRGGARFTIRLPIGAPPETPKEATL